MTDNPASSVANAPSESLGRVRESFSRQGLVGTLGAWLVELDAGRAVIEIPFSNRIAGEGGRFHAALVAGIAQACGGTAAATLANDGQALSPNLFSVTSQGPAHGDLLRAEAHAKSDGPSRWVATVRVTCQHGDVVLQCAAATLVLVARPKEP